MLKTPILWCCLGIIFSVDKCKNITGVIHHQNKYTVYIYLEAMEKQYLECEISSLICSQQNHPDTNEFLSAMFTVEADMKYLSSHCDTITRTPQDGPLFLIFFPGRYLKKVTSSNCWRDKSILEVSAFVIQQTLFIALEETAHFFEGQNDAYLLYPNVFTIEILRLMCQGWSVPPL